MLWVRADGLPCVQQDDEHVHCAPVSFCPPQSPSPKELWDLNHCSTIPSILQLTTRPLSFMALKPSQVGYFIQQVGLAAASFGVADEDVQAVGCALSSTFGYRCSPPTDPLTGPGPSSQSICTAENCPVDVGGVCALYPGGSGISPEPADNTPGCRRPV